MTDPGDRSTEQFLEQLKRRNLDGKRALIQDLRKRQTEKAMEILLDVLQDDSWYLRELAVAALREAGNKAVPGLLAILHGGLWYSRAAAIRALGAVGDGAVVPRLIEVLDESNRTVRDAALAALAEMSAGPAVREIARAFLAAGPERGEAWKREMLSLHPEAGRRIETRMRDPEGRRAADESTPPESRSAPSSDPS